MPWLGQSLTEEVRDRSWQNAEYELAPPGRDLDRW